MGDHSGGYVLAPRDGEHFGFLGTLATVKAGDAQTGGAFTLIEQVAPPGFRPPPHVHEAEDEAFYVLAGILRVTCDGQRWDAAPGAFVFLPRGVPHAFEVVSPEPARLLQLTVPARFEQFVAEVGERLSEPSLPEPTPPDVPRLLAAMAKHGYAPAAPPAGS